MTDESPETFDADYVKQLRSEAAKYRTKAKDLSEELEGYKGLEAQIEAIRVENELVRRGIEAEPQWVQIQDGEDPSQAVDRFLENYPQFGAGSQEQQPVEQEQESRKTYPKAMPPKPMNPNANNWGQRSLDEIKEDPAARQNLTDVYRDLLKTSSNQKD